LIGILSLECAVLPPGNNSAAIPDDATASAILFFDLIKFNNCVFKKLFPVPPGPSTKNTLCLFG